jgi:hypothetical protein
METFVAVVFVGAVSLVSFGVGVLWSWRHRTTGSGVCLTCLMHGRVHRVR